MCPYTVRVNAADRIVSRSDQGLVLGVGFDVFDGRRRLRLAIFPMRPSSPRKRLAKEFTLFDHDTLVQLVASTAERLAVNAPPPRIDAAVLRCSTLGGPLASPSIRSLTESHLPPTPRARDGRQRAVIDLDSGCAPQNEDDLTGGVGPASRFGRDAGNRSPESGWSEGVGARSDPVSRSVPAAFAGCQPPSIPRAGHSKVVGTALSCDRPWRENPA